MSEFNYVFEPKESVACALCGANVFFVLAKRSVNGLVARTCLCQRCGLIYLNPRMTKAGYDRYYQFFYREDRAEIKKHSGYTLAENFEKSLNFGRAFARQVRDFIRPGLVIDVGSSTGGVLAGFSEEISGVTVFGIEPSVAESEFANRKGIPTTQIMFENYNNETLRASAIICVQSLNHLLSPQLFFSWAFATLEEGGALILSVKNFRHQCRRAGSIEAGVQIDHPYMFVPETLRALVESAGFIIALFEVDENASAEELYRRYRAGFTRHHIRLVAIKRMGVEKPRPESSFRAGRIRWQLFRPYLYAFYLVQYSSGLGAVRKVIKSLSH